MPAQLHAAAKRSGPAGSACCLPECERTATQKLVYACGAETVNQPAEVAQGAVRQQQRAGLPQAEVMGQPPLLVDRHIIISCRMAVMSWQHSSSHRLGCFAAVMEEHADMDTRPERLTASLVLCCLCSCH